MLFRTTIHLIICLPLIVLLYFKASGNDSYSSHMIQNKIPYTRFTNKSFKGFVYSGDFDSNPDLDFVIEIQEKHGQNYYLNVFQYIWIHRDFDEKKVDIIEKIRSAINKCYLKEDNNLKEYNRVSVLGRYSSDPNLTQGKLNGFLELKAIWIYNKYGTRKPYIIEGGSYGVIGGVISCGPGKKEKNNQPENK